MSSWRFSLSICLSKVVPEDRCGRKETELAVFIRIKDVHQVMRIANRPKCLMKKVRKRRPISEAALRASSSQDKGTMNHYSSKPVCARSPKHQATPLFIRDPPAELDTCRRTRYVSRTCLGSYPCHNFCKAVFYSSRNFGELCPRVRKGR